MLDSTPSALPLGYRLLTAEVTFARIKKESSPMLEMVRPKIDCQFDRTGGVLGSVADESAVCVGSSSCQSMVFVTDSPIAETANRLL